MRPGTARTRIAVLVYGLASAALYSGLLPLWEGFDELYHYGYVQHVSTTATLPVIGKSSLSRELWTSLDYVAISHYIQPYVYRPSTSFPEYFHLPDAERESRRRGLDTIPSAFQREPSPRDNYEVKQAPLTYLLLALVDRLLAGAPLPLRVLALRELLSIATIVLLWFGTRGLARRLGLEGPAETASLFAIFSCQMLYGNACHIANDALMLPWLMFFLDAVIDSCQSPTLSRSARTGFLMALGILIKASLLIFLPFAFVAPVWILIQRRASLRQAARLTAVSAGIILALAGPWYVRNLTLYGSLTATLDTTSGVGPKELLSAAVSVPWRESIAGMAHSALWTGNNSFTTFSASTLDLVLFLLALAALLYGLRFRRSLPEVITVSGIAMYCAGLVYITLSFTYSSRGSVTAAMPWYMQVLLAPVIALCFLGLARWRRWGRWTAIATVSLWGYVALATWVAKLIPLYGGFEEAHARPRQLLAWYFQDSARRDSILANLCPAPLALLNVLFVAVLATLMITWIRVLAALLRGSALGFPPHELP
ncbi:MAG: hypothetical protein LAP38_08835 [Acidobacteriia bacterium]|nr:hypothetical protein [Terriglobia bacterium]